MCQSERNLKALESIDRAMFVLSLDDKPVTDATTATHAFLHNYGADRWFDKSFSLIVGSNGTSAINFEHAWGDGVAVLRLFTEMYRDTTEHPFVPPGGVDLSGGEGVCRLEFDLSEEVKAAVEEGRRAMEEKGRSLSVSTMKIDAFGRGLFKRKQLSPDAVMQLAFQVGWWPRETVSLVGEGRVLSSKRAKYNHFHMLSI